MLACTLMQRLRARALQGTELERASAGSIRVRLPKIGAAIPRNRRRVRVMLAIHHPLRELFATAAGRLAALDPWPLSQCLARTLTPTRPASPSGEGSVMHAAQR